jgi:hypothetical protein
MSQTKDTNPKAALGAAKPGLSVVPSTALYAMAAAHMDGAYKYGAHNWRVSGVSARTYYDAAMRHLTAWWEGEQIAPDSGVPHLGHVMACMAILLDAEANGQLNDDRPVALPEGWMERWRELHAELTADRTAVEPFTETKHGRK